MMIEIFLFIIVGMFFLCLYRIIKGPSIADRMVAIDIFGILVVGFCALITLLTGKQFFIDIGIAWVILSFIGTLTLAKYLGNKNLND